MSNLEDKFIIERSFCFPIALQLIDKFGIIEEVEEDKFDEYFVYLYDYIKCIWEIMLNGNRKTYMYI